MPIAAAIHHTSSTESEDDTDEFLVKLAQERRLIEDQNLASFIPFLQLCNIPTTDGWSDDTNIARGTQIVFKMLSIILDTEYEYIITGRRRLNLPFDVSEQNKDCRTLRELYGGDTSVQQSMQYLYFIVNFYLDRFVPMYNTYCDCNEMSRDTRVVLLWSKNYGAYRFLAV